MLRLSSTRKELSDPPTPEPVSTEQRTQGTSVGACQLFFALQAG